MSRKSFEKNLPENETDFMDEEIADAVKESWEDSGNWARIDHFPYTLNPNGKTQWGISIIGPTLDDESNCLSMRFDLIQMLDAFADEYRDIGGPRSDEQREDQLHCAQQLKKLGDYVLSLSEKAMNIAHSSAPK